MLSASDILENSALDADFEEELTRSSLLNKDTIDGIPVAWMEESIEQLKCLTLPNDKAQHAFLASLAKETVPKTKLTLLVDFLLQKVASSSTESSKMFREMQEAKEELRISENRASRLLLHLQQNVKLLSRLATGEGETTLVQEAAQNMASISSLDTNVVGDYLKQMKRALLSGNDPLAGVEVLELLKQEVSINAIIRKHTEKLFNTSKSLSDSVVKLRSEFAAKQKRDEKIVNEKLAEKDAFIQKIRDVTGIKGDSLLAGVQQMMREKEVAKKEVNSLKEMCARLKQQISATQDKQREQEESMRESRMELFNLLDVRCKAASEFDAFMFAVSAAVPLIRDMKETANMLGVSPREVVKAVSSVKAQTEELKQTNERTKALMVKQAEAIETLETNNRWATTMSGSVDGEVSERVPASPSRNVTIEMSSMTEDSTVIDIDQEDHLNQLDELQTQFTEIERELRELQQQITHT